MLGVIIPARNEEQNIANVINSIIKLGIRHDDIFVVDSCSEDNTAEISIKLNVNIIAAQKIGYQNALSEGLSRLKVLGYKSFLIVDGDNEIGMTEIKKILDCTLKNYSLVIGSRKKFKRLSEAIVNKFFFNKFGINDLMCGVKLGKVKLYNPSNSLEFCIDLFKFEDLTNKMVANVPIDINLRDETRLGNTFLVNYSLIKNLLLFILFKKK